MVKSLMRGRKAKRTAYLTKEINKSHDKQSSHMSVNKRSETDLKRSKKEQSETDLRTIKERVIGNRSKNNQRKNDQKPI